MFDVETKLSDNTATLRRMRTLPDKLQKKALKTAMRRGATVTRRAAIKNMHAIDDPDSQNKIFKNVVVQFASRTSKKIDGVMMRVGVLGGSKQYTDNVYNRQKGRVGKSFKTLGSKANPGGDTWYWRYVEFGVPSLGIPARRPMLKALQSTAQAATDVIAKTLDKEIDKLVPSVASPLGMAT